MKKITLILSMVFAVIAMTAQTIVSTTPENKNVILEEFTGIHCGYCPDGHKRSNQIAAANPSDFFAINIHAGNYAIPGTGEPDFRTSFGTALANQSGLSGYPAGTVNRHVFSGSSTALSRGEWAPKTTIALAEASYVNIAATGNLDLDTRVVDILVEVYVTGTAPATMALNVAVIQNNVEGPQSSMNTNPSQVLPNGKYNHMHVLRHLITGQWGETIATAGGTGTFISKTYQYTIPTDINGVEFKLKDLEIVAFLAEGHQEIITGNQAVMSYVAPTGFNMCDLSIENITTVPELCASSVIPSIKITNNSTTVTADTFEVNYSMNGGTEMIQTITTPLAPGANTTISFTAETITETDNIIKFNVNTDDVIHLLDYTVENNKVESNKFYRIPSATIGSVYEENFESYAAMSNKVDNATIDNPNDFQALIVSKNSFNVSYQIGGFGSSTNSYLFRYYNIPASQVINMMLHKMDFSSNTGYGLKFNYAYAQSTNENDKLEIEVSTDCGATWTQKWSKQGADLATAPKKTGGDFIPKADQWKQATIDLSAYDNNTDVIIAFKGTSDYGNDLFIDDIRVYNSTDVGIETVENTNSVNVYPNPANDKFNLELDLNENAAVNYTIFNNLGQIVLSADLGDLNTGNQNEIVNISNLANGIYIVQININNTTITKKLTVN